VECRDLLYYAPEWLRSSYPATYYFLVRHLSLLWGWCFGWFDHPLGYALVQPVRRAWNLWTARGLVRRLRQDPPAVIVTTHFFPTDVVDACKQAGWLKTPLVVAVTDLHPHRFWISHSAEAYAVAIPRSASVLEARGIRPERIHVQGIPIAGRFRAAFDRSEVERMFGLQPGRRTLLVTSGGTTIGPFDAVAEALLGMERLLPGRVQLLIVCGMDGAAVRRLSAKAAASPMPAKVVGFIETMAEAMSISDLVIAKAGGVTVTEALGRGVPLLLYHVIPGQEQLNAWHAASHGAAIIVPPRGVPDAVRAIYGQAGKLEAMQQAARSLGRPDAAERIAVEIVKPLVEGR